MEIVHRRHHDVCKQRGYEDWTREQHLVPGGKKKKKRHQWVEESYDLSKGRPWRPPSPGTWSRRIERCPNESRTMAEGRWSGAQPSSSQDISEADLLEIRPMLGKGLVYLKELVSSSLSAE